MDRSVLPARRSRRIRLLAGLLALGSLNACAFRNPDNTPLTRWTEHALGLEDAGPLASAAFVPLALPLGIVDIAVVHPIQVLDDSYVDTVQDLWSDRDAGTASESYFLIPRVAYTPLRYTGAFLARSFFDIDPPVVSTESDAPDEWQPPSERDALESELESLRSERESEIEARDRAQERIGRIEAEIERLRRELEALPPREDGPEH